MARMRGELRIAVRRAVICTIERLWPRRWCWGELVAWAYSADPWRDLRLYSAPKYCRRAARTNEPYAACECGKFISPQWAARYMKLPVRRKLAGRRVG